jgi:large subunit ribosomal protein L35
LAKYKIKTHSGAKKRFTISGSGKIMRRKIGVNNFRRKKRGETLREIGSTQQVSDHVKKRLRRLMPYA